MRGERRAAYHPYQAEGGAEGGLSERVCRRACGRWPSAARAERLPVCLSILGLRARSPRVAIERRVRRNRQKGAAVPCRADAGCSPRLRHRPLVITPRAGGQQHAVPRRRAWLGVGLGLGLGLGVGLGVGVGLGLGLGLGVGVGLGLGPRRRARELSGMRGGVAQPQIATGIAVVIAIGIATGIAIGIATGIAIGMAIGSAIGIALSSQLQQAAWRGGGGIQPTTSGGGGAARRRRGGPRTVGWMPPPLRQAACRGGPGR